MMMIHVFDVVSSSTNSSSSQTSRESYNSERAASKSNKNNKSSTSSSLCSDFHSVFLVISAAAVKSAYASKDQKGPFEDGSFVTKHSAQCLLTLFEEPAIPLTGYLPQDVDHRDIFSFWHRRDLPYMQEIYRIILREQGKAVQSQPYRFKVANGGYAVLDTIWSCFINPWSRQLEFVMGKHKVLQGPDNPNIFDWDPCNANNAGHNENSEDDEEAIRIKEDIKASLATADVPLQMELAK